jgi:hypothetical protein
MAGKYVGFDKLKGEMAKRPAKDARALASAVGRKKYHGSKARKGDT